MVIGLMATARTPGVSIESTIRWVPWPIAAMLVALLLVVAFPEPALWPPRRTGYG